MFVRTILAMSLSCILAGTAFAASTTEQPLTPKKIIDTSVQDPIDPLATDVASASTAVANSQITAKEQADLNQASQTLDQLEQSEDKTADVGAAPSKTTTAPTTTTTNPAAAKASWTLNGLNSAEWFDNIGKGQFPVYARAHVMLNNAHASPGAIDGMSGKNTLKAIASFQQMSGLKATGTLTKETWDALLASQGSKPAFIEYTITEADLKGPYAASIPRDYALQAKMKGLYYTRVTEMLGEKFHMDEDFLQKLNPKATFKKRAKKLLWPISAMKCQKTFI